MIRILGIDPGSRVTGYGVIDSDGRYSRYVASGAIRVKGESLSDRLGFIFHEVTAVIARFQPRQMAIEDVFMAKSAASALKLGQARGAAICAGAAQSLPIGEYAPRLIKQAVVGSGGADKAQVQHMVGVLLNYKEGLQADAADALAVALCHSHSQTAVQRLSRGGRA